MLEDWLANSIRALARRLGWRIPPVLFVIGGFIWGIWEIASHVSVFAWLREKWQNPSITKVQEAEIHQIQMLLSKPGSVPVIVFCVGILWLTYLVWPVRRAGAARPGRTIAHGEVWNPFPITDRDPRITIEFDKSPQPKRGLTIRPIRLRNDGGTDAYKVHLMKISLSAGHAEFREIPHLRRDQSEVVEVKILDPNTREPYSVNDFEMLLDTEVKRRSTPNDHSPFEVKCYIFYEDHSRKRFKTHATLSHDVVTGLTVARDYSFFELKLAKPRRFSFLRWPRLCCFC